ncbi:MAG: UbiA family prenyltransferase [Planctomycetota bacterium]|nr:UbiA family prenyltransferase [Planctomycetota bacterium]
MQTSNPPVDTERSVRRSAWLAYWQLLRVPAVFTAIADILLGFVITQGSFEPYAQFAGILLSSICLYWAGMVLNDVFDVKQDTLERPHRPIPSGRVSMRGAIMLSALMIVISLVSAASVGMQTLCVSSLLLVSILAYDGLLKSTVLGPLAMGSCRLLNVMLGASLAEQLWSVPQSGMAIGLGIYIAGVTWFARTEAVQSRKLSLSGGIGVVNLGLVSLTGLMINSPTSTATPALILLGMVALTINARLFRALSDPSPKTVQQGVRLMLLSLITLDASLILFQTGDPIYAGVTLALLLPATQLSRFIPMT